MRRDATLEITDFIGTSIEAVHYYGTIRLSDGKKLDVEWCLNEYQAKMLNKANDGYSYKAGDMTFRFFERDQVLLHAMMFLKKHTDAKRVFVRTPDFEFIVRTDEFDIHGEEI